MRFSQRLVTIGILYLINSAHSTAGALAKSQKDKEHKTTLRRNADLIFYSVVFPAN